MLQALSKDKSVFKSLAEKTAYLHKGIEAVLIKHGIPHTINRLGSMISVHFCEAAVTDFSSAAAGDNETFKILSRYVITRGLFTPVCL